MQTGIITSAQLADVLRDISQKRKQGILELSVSDWIINISFVTGKIVNFSNNKNNLISTFIDKLKACNKLSTSFNSNAISYEDLYHDILASADGSQFSTKMYVLLVREQILDSLLKIDFSAGAFFNFKVQMVTCDAELNPSISVGQLLLDLVEYKEDLLAFNNMFEQSDYVKINSDCSNCGELDSLFYNLMTSPISIKDLHLFSPLSALRFQQILLDGIEKGKIIKVDKNSLTTDIDISNDIDGIIEALEGVTHTSDKFINIESVEPTIQVEKGSLQASNIQENLKVSNISKQSIEDLNNSLLQANWIPNLVVVLFIICALYAPFVFWPEALAYFSDI
jgi:hypothetical protein